MSRTPNKNISLLLLALLITISPALAKKKSTATTRQDSDFRSGQAVETFLNIFRTVELYYVDSTDPEGMIKRAADSMLEGMDPYTTYITAEGMEEFETMTTGKYAGIGSLIRKNGPWVEIAEPYKDSPADRAGIRAGDRIVAIDSESMRGKSASQVSNILRGKPNTKFELTVEPIASQHGFGLRDSTVNEANLRTVTITRERISIPAVSYSGLVGDSIGYIALGNFTENCATEFRRSLLELKRQGATKGMIIDLRGNGGGILGEAVRIMSQLLPRNTTVVTTRGKVAQTNTTYRTQSDPIELSTPIVVLIDEESASASEIVAGGLQDLDRAVIIGQRSFGKGLVQSTRPVGDGGYIKLTSARYYTPSGRCIQALDYSHRDSSGRVSSIADSLIREFRTTNGRKVYDGGGINPDVKIAPEYLSKFTAILISLGYIEDFANLYAAQHIPTKGPFSVDDSTYALFTDFMRERPIKFDSGTKYRLEELRRMAQREKYLDRITAELDAIEQKIQEDKMAELITFSDEIRERLTAEIIVRWDYQAGEAAHNISNDPEVKRAIEILSDRPLYNKIVTTQDTERK